MKKEIEEAKQEIVSKLSFIRESMAEVVDDIIKIKSRLRIEEDWNEDKDGVKFIVNFDTSLFPKKQETGEIYEKLYEGFLQKNFCSETLIGIYNDLFSYITALDGTGICEVDILSGKKIQVRNCD